MAAPTSVRVESTSLTTATVRWISAGSAGFSVYQSTNGTDYTLVTQDILATDTNYDVQGLDSATKYWFKMSDDFGSTFSSVVTVVVQTCAGATGQLTPIVMPRVDAEVTAESFNELADRIEVGLNRFISPDGRTCVACVSDNALVVDCIDYEGCNSIDIVTTTDINSISLPNCDDTTVNLNFLVPPNTTVGIGGWPRGIGFSGDEAFTSPVSGGSSGTSIKEKIIPGGINDNQSSGRSRPGTPGGSGERRGAGGRNSTTGNGCTCQPTAAGGLNIVTCQTDGSPNSNNSLNCSAATPGLKALACGGRGPYTWSATGDVVLSGTAGSSVSASLPANAGSGEAGTAYIKYGGRCETNTGIAAPCPAFQFATFAESFGCNDQSLGACGSVFTQLCPCSGNCASTPVNLGTSSCSSITACTDSGTCASGTCDSRSAAMIAAGCNPCGTVGAGSTITVTDDLGTTVVIVLGS